MDDKQSFEEMKSHLLKKLNDMAIMDFVDVSNDLVYISNRLSVKDLLEVFQVNRTNVVLIYSEEQVKCVGILVLIDLLNVVLAISEKPELLNDPAALDGFLEGLSIDKMVREYRTFMDRESQELFSVDIKEKLTSVLKSFRSNKIGHVLVTVEQGREKTQRREFFSIFTKKQFLLNMLRNFHATEKDLFFLQRPIGKAFPESILPMEKLLRLQDSQTLAEAFRVIQERKVD